MECSLHNYVKRKTLAAEKSEKSECPEHFGKNSRTPNEKRQINLNGMFLYKLTKLYNIEYYDFYSQNYNKSL